MDIVLDNIRFNQNIITSFLKFNNIFNISMIADFTIFSIMIKRF
jgi:hypothetical protein